MKLLRIILLSFLLIIHSYHLCAVTDVNFVPVAGSPFATGVHPNSVAYSPVINGNVFAAVANSSNTSVSVYSVDALTGAFTPVIGSPFATGPVPLSVAFSPVITGNITDNVFAAATSLFGSTVSVYSVDGMTGAFTPVTGSPFATGPFPNSVAFSPIITDNVFAAVTNSNNRTVSVFSVDGTGAFTPVTGSPFTTGSFPSSVAYSPIITDNVFAAVTNENDSTVSVFSVDGTTGVFAEITGSPFTTGPNPHSVAYSPVINGNLFAAVANGNDSTVSVFSVDGTTGVFAEITDSPFMTGNNPRSVAYSPVINGNLFAAVANGNDNTISVYSVDGATGAFIPITGSPFATGSFPDSVAFSPVITGNVFAAVTNSNDSTVSVYTVILPPSVLNVNPNTGPSTGGTIVTISGEYFIDVTNVQFGGIPASSFIIDNERQIRALSPPGNGTVDITVTTPLGTSLSSPADRFTYVPPPLVLPIVTGVNPSAGPMQGGTPVTITGENFIDVIDVFFGLNPAVFEIDSETQITAISPPGIGTVNVFVRTSAGSSISFIGDAFTYVPNPQSPKHAKGCQKIKACNQGECGVNVLTWKAPSDNALIVKYQIYNDKSLCKLLGTVPKNVPYKFKNSSQIGKSKTYYIISVNTFGQRSEPVKVKVKRLCQ